MRLWFAGFVYVLYFCGLPQAEAVMPCFHESIGTYGKKLLRKTTEYRGGSPTKRQTVAEYADSHKDIPNVAEKFAATGKLKCTGGTSTANLIVKGDIIVGAAHPFVDRLNNCKPGSDPAKCKFVVEGQPPIEIEKLISMGVSCPTKTHPMTDWAILKLKRPVTGVKPYKIKTRSEYDGVKEQAVVAVGSHSIDFRRKDPKTKKEIMPKHVQDCAIKRVFYGQNPPGLASNCDGSLGKSGGALLDPDLKEPTLMGITIGIPLGTDVEAERRTGKPTQTDFDTEQKYDTGIAVAGTFYDEIQKATQ